MKYLDLYNMVDRFRTFCVVDESITIKNTEAGRTQRLLELAHRFKYRLILSGTPLTQGLIDLYSQIKFMNPAILNMTESQFANNFLHVSYDQDKTRRKWSCPEKEQHLIKLMRPYIYECDLDFDCPIKRHDYNFNLSAKEAEYYQMEKEDFLQSKEKIAFLEVVQKFQHIYTISYQKTLAMIHLVKDIIKRGEKVIIFIKFVDEIRFLKECRVLDFKYVEMTGNVNKNKIADAFAKDVPVMFSTYGAGGSACTCLFVTILSFFRKPLITKTKSKVWIAFTKKEKPIR